MKRPLRTYAEISGWTPQQQRWATRAHDARCSVRHLYRDSLRRRDFHLLARLHGQPGDEVLVEYDRRGGWPRWRVVRFPHPWGEPVLLTKWKTESDESAVLDELVGLLWDAEQRLALTGVAEA